MKLSVEPSFPPLPEEIRDARRPKMLAYEAATRRFDEVMSKEDREPTPEEVAELLHALEAAARDELAHLRAMAEECGSIPNNGFDVLRTAVKEHRLTPKAGKDVEAFLSESEILRDNAHDVLANLLDIVEYVEQAEALLAESHREAAPVEAQKERRKFIKAEMDRWGYVGVA